jgi:hypothetical protein
MSLFDFFRRKHSKSAVVTNSRNVTVNQIENYTQKDEATIDWVGLSIYTDDQKGPSYSLVETDDKILIKPLFTLQSKSDWPGKYKLEFPLVLDFTFNNSGDKPAVLNSVEIEVLDATIDNQAAFEARPEVNEEGYLMLQLENYGWGNNEVLNYIPFSDDAKKFWDMDDTAFASINMLEGHLTLVLRPELAGKLVQITESEHKQLISYHESLHNWIPHPLFGKNNEETDDLRQFLSLRNKLIAESKILNSENFYGKLVYKENSIQKEFMLNWGYVEYSATAYDLIRTKAGFELIRYQHPLAYLPPGMEYQAKISVNDKGKTITVKTSQSIEGGKSDRFLMAIHPMECLFADVSLKVNFNKNRQIVYPKILKFNLLEYKDNGDYQKAHDDIPVTEYEYSNSEGKLVVVSDKLL